MIPRELGRVIGADAGATLIVVAGLHGNEPAGLEAGRRVLERLFDDTRALRGELLVLAGNCAALERKVRFIERDLNRSFSAEHIARVEGKDPSSLTAEDRELGELLQAMDAAIARARGPVYLADCHTSSAPGVPFVLYGATPAQREFVEVFPLPVISGIVEQVEGVLSECMSARGLVTFSVEGGQHDAPVSRDSLEAIVWLSLERAGMVQGRPECRRSAALLDELRGDLPRLVDVVSRHAIGPEDDFVMEPGFRNVDRVTRGHLLARDCRGEVRAPEDGVVVLPLYQKQGNDGFFWGRER